MGEVMYRCRMCLKEFSKSEIEYDKEKLYTLVKPLNGKESFIQVNQVQGKCPHCGSRIDGYIEEIEGESP